MKELTPGTKKIVSPGEVLIRVKAYGISHNKLHSSNSDKYSDSISQMPGHEIAGIIEQVADNVTTVSPGDHVGVPWFNSDCFTDNPCHPGNSHRNEGDHTFNEYVKASAASVHRIPTDISFSQAAPLLYAGLTGYKALNIAEVRQGETVAIYGIRGMGHLAIQLASNLGAEVIALTNSRDIFDQCHEFGATDCIAGQPTDLALCLKEMGGADVLLSTLPILEDLSLFIGALRNKGRLILAGAKAGPVKLVENTEEVNKRKLSILGAPTCTKEDMESVFSLASRGAIKAKIQEYPLKEARAALFDIHRGRVKYRAVLTP